MKTVFERAWFRAQRDQTWESWKLVEELADKEGRYKCQEIAMEKMKTIAKQQDLAI